MDGSNNTETKTVAVMQQIVFVIIKIFAFKRIRKRNCIYF